MILSVLWLLGVSLFLTFAGSSDAAGRPVDTLRFVMVLIAVFMPIALIWVAASAARSSRIMKEESARLQSAINAMRHTYVQQAQASATGLKPSVEQKLEEIAAAQRKTDAAIAMFTSIRPSVEEAVAKEKAALAQVLPPQEQPSFELGTPAEALAPPLSVGDFIKALHFPETSEDKEGFRALRRALQDRGAAQLVQAAQDILTLLSQDGIYMDDLRPDRARPEVWRRFAQGERGRAIATLGGIRDRSSLALAAGRMRSDPIFRDSAHHFLRKFDQTFAGFEKNATDAEISELADTRTARAFMLLGRVTGTFD
jgi:D-alanyl-D-alanine dipeptidase